MGRTSMMPEPVPGFRSSGQHQRQQTSQGFPSNLMSGPLESFSQNLSHMAGFLIQAWPTLKCYARLTTATGCSVPRVALKPSTTSCSSAGTRSQWTGQPSIPCSGNLKTSLPWLTQNTRRLQPIDTQQPTSSKINDLFSMESNFYDISETSLRLYYRKINPLQI